MTEDIIGQKVKNVMIIVELENGQALIARPSSIGDVDELVTMKDLQRLMGNNDGSEDMKFMSPFVFALDLQDAGRRWIEAFYKEKSKQGGRFWTMYEKGKMDMLREFLNLEDEDD